MKTNIVLEPFDLNEYYHNPPTNIKEALTYMARQCPEVLERWARRQAALADAGIDFRGFPLPPGP